MERDSHPSAEPHPNGTTVIFSINEGVGVAKVIDGWLLDKPMIVPSTDESIPASIVPVGTPFNRISISRIQNPVKGFEAGTTHTFATAMLRRHENE